MADKSLTVNEAQQIFGELKQEHPNLNKIGKIVKESRWSHLINGLGHRMEPRLLLLVEKANQTFIGLEQKGIKVFDPTIHDALYREKARVYQEKHQLYFNLTKEIQTQISHLQKVSPELKKACHELQCREAGLRYSLGASGGGVDVLEKPNQDQLENLIQRAQDWKNAQKLAVNRELNALELEQLAELAKYPEWLEVVYQNPAYLSEVFNWCLRDYNSVEIIVKCCETRRQLKASLLASSLGYLRNPDPAKQQEEVLAFRIVPTKTDRVAKRILTASIYHGSFKRFEPEKQERINILKPKERIFFRQGNYSLTVEEFLKEVSQKNLREVNINLCSDWGFVNFHSVKGVWNAETKSYELPHMTENDWVDHVPMGPIVDHEALVEQYGNEVKNRRFFFKVAATRQHLDLNALDCHSFLQLYLRMEDGRWKVINAGIYAHRYQRGLLDGLWLFCATLKRVFALIDQNATYTHRQRAAYPIFPEEQEGRDFCARIYLLVLSDGVFQFAGKNCANSIQNITKKFFNGLPNFFRIRLTQAKTGVPSLDRILAWADRQGDRTRWLAVTILHTLFLSHRGRWVKKPKGYVWFSAAKYLNKKHTIYNPAFLPYQIAKARQNREGPFVNGELIGVIPRKNYFKHGLFGKFGNKRGVSLCKNKNWHKKRKKNLCRSREKT